MVADEKMEEDLDFFLNNNVSQNYLTNISYAGVKEEDLYDRNFIFSTHFLITKNINPFSLQRKIYDVKDREMIQMFWS